MQNECLTLLTIFQTNNVIFFKGLSRRRLEGLSKMQKHLQSTEHLNDLYSPL